MPRSQKGGPRRVLLTIACLFLASGFVRLGTVGYAVAKVPEVISDAAQEPTQTRPNAPTDASIDSLLRVIAERTKALDAREDKLANWEAALALSEQVIAKNLAELEQAELSLKATISAVDGASETDLDQLTRMYASMKPKIAAQLFEQMTPEFAAGFLGRMAPDAAGAILSGVTSENAYAISVVLAGRNANAPND